MSEVRGIDYYILKASNAHKRRLSAESDLGELSIAVCELLQFIDIDEDNELVKKCRLAMQSQCEVWCGCE